MLSHEDQEALVRVGPGTRMGAVMRRYWHPVATSDQLPRPNCAPLRVRLLGENLIVFRDSAGAVGVLEEYCAHRGVSLALGRVEDCGIRCLYHGWKFAVDGTIQETPNYADPQFRQRFKQPAFPVVERAGLIWTYLGAELAPPFRSWQFESVPDEQRVILRVNVRTNYLQLWEGGADSSHVGLLHSNMVRPEWRTKQQDLDAELRRIVMVDQTPELEFEDTPFGFRYAALRAPVEAGLEPGTRYVRIVPIIMPSMRMIPGADYTTTVFETPDDDNNTSTYLVMHAVNGKPLERQRYVTMLGLDDERFWSEKDCRFRPTWDEGLLQDRDGMGDSFTGFRGIEIEDAVMSLSCAPFSDRSKEHLVPADQGVIRLRRRLLDCIKLCESGESPLGVQTEDMSRVVAVQVNMRPSERWQDFRTDTPANVSA
jgi:phthalate 4,5-dioxygenase